MKMRMNQRGFTLGELMVVLFFLALIGSGMLYGLYRLVGYFSGPNDSGQKEMVENWTRGASYTLKSFSCQSVAIVARCTIRVEEAQAPFSVDCNTVTKQCSITPVGAH